VWTCYNNLHARTVLLLNLFQKLPLARILSMDSTEDFYSVCVTGIITLIIVN